MSEYALELKEQELEALDRERAEAEYRRKTEAVEFVVKKLMRESYEDIVQVGNALAMRQLRRESMERVTKMRAAMKQDPNSYKDTPQEESDLSRAQFGANFDHDQRLENIANSQ